MKRALLLTLLLILGTTFVLTTPGALALTATTTTVASSSNPSLLGQTVTFTATVTGGTEGSPVQISFNGNFTPLLSLHNGVAVSTATFSGPPRTVQVIASYLGDANTSPSSSAPLNQVIQAGLGLAPTSISVTSSNNPGFVSQTITYTATVSGGGATPPTGMVSFYTSSKVPFTVALGAGGTAAVTDAFATAGTYPITASYSGDSNNAGSASAAIGQVIEAPAAQPPLQFFPVKPCRVVDTRNAPGPLGGPAIAGGQTRSFPIPQSGCGIPATAGAYSINVTVVPIGSLGYLSVWPTGQPQPTISLLNSVDGRVKANAAIIPAGTSGAISVFANAKTPTYVIIDINGYFAPATASSLQFFPITACRVVDTRNPAGPLGGPYLPALTARSFPVQSSNCQIPPTAQAYSFNVTAIPAGTLGFLTTWPTGQAQPVVSTLNDVKGTITANAAIVPAGTGGSVSVYVTNDTEVLLDVNGYFAPPGVGGTNLYTTTPCRAFDTRNYPYSPFPGSFVVSIQGSSCSVSDVAAAYVLNATVIPPYTPLGYLTLWPAATPQPVVSTLNATDGSLTSNMAIVEDNDGAINAYASNATQLVLDVSAYFAP
jgi:hypothetical protein